MRSPTQTRGWRCLLMLKPKIKLPSGWKEEFSVIEGAREKLNTHEHTHTHSHIHLLHAGWHMNWEHQDQKGPDWRRTRPGPLPVPHAPVHLLLPCWPCHDGGFWCLKKGVQGEEAGGKYMKSRLPTSKPSSGRHNSVCGGEGWGGWDTRFESDLRLKYQNK